MKHFLAILFTLLFTNMLFAQRSMDIAFVKTAQDQWQLIDGKGKILADSLFEHESMALLNCNEGMLVVERGGKYGFRNIFDRTIISPRFDSVGFFVKGRTSVQIGKDWHWLSKTGIVDKSAVHPSLIVPYTQPFEDTSRCFNNYCLLDADSFINCKGPDGKLILSTDDMLIAPWNDAQAFANNRILKYKIMANKVCSCQKLTNYYGFIDRNGKWIIEPGFEQADIFSCSLAAVSEGSENIYTYGYIDMQGNWKISPIYKEADRFMRVSE